MDLDNFHFIRPFWLLATIALVLGILLLKRYRVQQSGWQSFIPEHLTKVLISEKNSHKPLSLALPFIVGLLAIVAMAGPTWKKLPQPVYQVARGSVVILDLSYSMYATDVSPNRMTRARYKVIDLLETLNEGEIGLIAYAGDAFTISPLTEDIKNIHLLLPALSPDIMPVLGSNPLSALTLAETMLLNAGHIQGDIYWFTDGIDNEDISDIHQWSSLNDYSLNILGIGTANGAPIKLSDGELMKDHTGSIIVPKLHNSPLQQVAAKASGKYVTLSHNNQDVESLLKNSSSLEQKHNENEQRESQNIGDQWQDMGPYLIFLILPLMLIYFRRGVLVCLLAILLNISSPQPAYADTWDSLWKTSNQQAQDKFNEKSYSDAANQFTDPLWQGSAHYKAGDYEKSLSAFEKVDSAQSLYNQGNALAKLQRFDEAITAFDKALSKNPDLADAQANKEIIEALKEQQEEQENSDKNEQSSEDSAENDQQEGDDKQSSDSDKKEGDESNDSDSAQNNEQGADSDDSEAQSEQGENSEEKDGDKSDSQEDSERKESDSESKGDKDESKDNESLEDQAKQGDKENDEAESTPQALSELSPEEAEKAKEMAQKHQQLLNKVTDDPYMLIRNKMKLEYRKRRHNQSPSGVQKQW